jgi:PEP-CTERM motif
MRTTRTIRALLCAAAAVAAPSVMQAQYTLYTTLASFLAAVGTSATENFSGLPAAGVPTASPYTRTLGGFSFRINIENGFRTVGSPANPALSAAVTGKQWNFDGFSSNVRAFGGNFWVTDASGAAAGGFNGITVFDIAGNSYVIPGGFGAFGGNTPDSFWGIVLTNPLSRIEMNSFTFGSSQVYGTVDNFVVASGPTGTVPEPATYALFGAGLLCVGGVARRRRAAM